MPIYEFYCPDCHTIFNFFSRSVNTAKRPNCPKCGKRRLERQVSAFAMTGRKGEDSETDDLPVDEGKMEKALEALAGQAEGLDENDPRQAARLMRQFSSMTGMQFGDSMEEALGRMEAGEDPEKIESEMGDLMDENEEPFVLPGRKTGGGRKRTEAPARDSTLYDL